MLRPEFAFEPDCKFIQNKTVNILTLSIYISQEIYFFMSRKEIIYFSFKICLVVLICWSGTNASITFNTRNKHKQIDRSKMLTYLQAGFNLPSKTSPAIVTPSEQFVTKLLEAHFSNTVIITGPIICIVPVLFIINWLFIMSVSCRFVKSPATQGANTSAGLVFQKKYH